LSALLSTSMPSQAQAQVRGQDQPQSETLPDSVVEAIPSSLLPPGDDTETPDKESSTFRDPADGKFDISTWLLNRRGFLPVPIIITDPALGRGGGLALTYFRRPSGAKVTRTTTDGRTQMVAPNRYTVGGLRTSNGSQAFFGGFSLHFKDDLWRYSGAVSKTSFNLGFYPPAELFPDQEINYNVDGLMSYQQVSRRLGSQQLYAGAQWVYMDVDLSFDNDSDKGYFDDKSLARKLSGLGLALKYDSRDNSFTPSSGWFANVSGTFFDEAVGSANNFQNYRARAYDYIPLGDVVIGARADLRWANGDVPFYRLPYVDMRGIGSARYQDTRATTLETEVRWNVDSRWALIGFLGAGRTWGRNNSFGDGQTAVSKGTGFRYLLASKLGMYAGLDYAWGPEDQTFYITVGSAWR